MRNLYRALYQLNETGKIRGMTFTAENAEKAAEVAEDWQLPGDKLLTVKDVRPVAEQFELV